MGELIPLHGLDTTIPPQPCQDCQPIQQGFYGILQKISLIIATRAMPWFSTVSIPRQESYQLYPVGFVIASLLARYTLTNPTFSTCTFTIVFKLWHENYNYEKAVAKTGTKDHPS